MRDTQASAIGSPSAGSASDSLGDRVRSLRLPPPNQGGQSGSGRLVWVLCLLLVGSNGVLGYLFWSRSADRGDAVEPAASQPAVETPADVAAPAQPGRIVLESKGYIIPRHQILVSPEVSGRVLRLFVEEGKKVERGEVLAEIEPIEYQADFQRAKASLELNRQRLLELENGNRPEEIEQALKELEEVQAQLAQLDAELQRSRTLRASDSVSQQEYELIASGQAAAKARAERLTAKWILLKKGPRVEQIEVARAEVLRAEADLAKAKWRLDNCTIRAPVSGTILRKNAEEGNIVNPVAFNGSFSLCEMADLSDLEVELNIQERDISRVFKGQRCLVRAEAFPDRVYPGVVSRLMPIADRAKGAVPVRVKLSVPKEEEGVYLKPEMGAVVSFLADDVAKESDEFPTADGAR